MRKEEERRPKGYDGVNTMNDSNLLQVIDVKKSFFRAKALAGLSFNLEKGVILGLLGPNGSGKSSLLKIISGLYRPSDGKVLIQGEVPSRKTKAKVAYLPEIDYLYPWMSVRQTLDFVSTFYDDWNENKALELLKFMNLDPEVTVGKLSKGMRARLKLALTMGRDSSLILLDEPFSGIDPPSRARIMESIIAQYSTGEQSIILSTHEVGESEKLFDRVLFLENGRLKLMGEAEELRQEMGKSINDIFKEVYQ